MKTNHTSILLTLAFFFIAFTGCDRNSPESFANDYAVKESMPVEESETTANIQLVSKQRPEQMLIKNASLRIQVENLENSWKEIKTTIEQNGGFVSHDNLLNLNEMISRDVVIRVPAENLEAIVDQIAARGVYVDARTINSQDVGEEYIDTEIRIKSKKAVLDQYLKLLGRATEIEDILKIENEIRQIQEEVEAKEGRLRYLDDRVRFSTVELSMYQEIINAQAPPSENYWLQVKEQVARGWNIVKYITLGVITIWPLFLLLGIGLAIVRFRNKKMATEK